MAQTRNVCGSNDIIKIQVSLWATMPKRDKTNLLRVFHLMLRQFEPDGNRKVSPTPVVTFCLSSTWYCQSVCVVMVMNVLIDSSWECYKLIIKLSWHTMCVLLQYLPPAVATKRHVALPHTHSMHDSDGNRPIELPVALWCMQKFPINLISSLYRKVSIKDQRRRNVSHGTRVVDIQNMSSRYRFPIQCDENHIWM